MRCFACSFLSLFCYNELMLLLRQCYHRDQTGLELVILQPHPMNPRVTGMGHHAQLGLYLEGSFQNSLRGPQPTPMLGLSSCDEVLPLSVPYPVSLDLLPMLLYTRFLEATAAWAGKSESAAEAAEGSGRPRLLGFPPVSLGWNGGLCF